MHMMVTARHRLEYETTYMSECLESKVFWYWFRLFLSSRGPPQSAHQAGQQTLLTTTTTISTTHTHQ